MGETELVGANRQEVIVGNLRDDMRNGKVSDLMLRVSDVLDPSVNTMTADDLIQPSVNLLREISAEVGTAPNSAALEKGKTQLDELISADMSSHTSKLIGKNTPIDVDGDSRSATLVRQIRSLYSEKKEINKRAYPDEETHMSETIYTLSDSDQKQVDEIYKQIADLKVQLFDSYYGT